MCTSKKPHYSPQFNRNVKKEKLKDSLLLFGLVNLLWLVLRTGTKPSRIVYPCQQAALDNLSFSLAAFAPLPILSLFFTKVRLFLSTNKKLFLVIVFIAVISGGLLWKTPSPSQEIQLVLESQTAIELPASDVYVVNGRSVAHFTDLVNLMSSHNLLFYKSSEEGGTQGSEGLIAHNDVVLLKVNAQWAYRGGTNTDLLREVIQSIVNHPDGFTGEIVVADNGQGLGAMDRAGQYNNAEDLTQSFQRVVNMFSSTYNVSTYRWDDIREVLVDEYSEGDMKSGYIFYNSSDPETGIYVSYPKFETEFGTFISVKNGIWNGTAYEKRLKIINMPVLKSHQLYGVTASLKNFMGVISEELNGGTNSHVSVATGGMGTVMIEIGLPTLNLVDAIWVNANPYPSTWTGPTTSFVEATRVNVLIAGVEPVALDYWIAKHILIPVAKSIGYSDDETHTLDPDNTERSGLKEAFGVWLNLTKDELIRAGYNVTTNENRMNVYVHQDISQTSSSTSLTSSVIRTSGFSFICVGLTLAAIICSIFVLRRRKRHKSKNIE